MQLNDHERARALVDRSAVEGIGVEGVSLGDERWLETHLERCTDCARYAELTARAAKALSGFAFAVDPAATFAIEQAVRTRAAHMATSPSGRLRALAFPLAILMTLLGSAAAWEVAQDLAAIWHLPAELWRAGFLTFWVLPSVIVDGLLFVRGRFERSDSEGGME